MSRYEHTPPGWPPHCSLVIGWDVPLGSYFALVIDTTINREQQGEVAAFGGEPPHFRELDNLLSVVNRRLRDRLPPIQLTGELRQLLRKDAKSKRSVINALTVSDPGKSTPAPPLTRPSMALGTHQGCLEGYELRAVLDGMAEKYFRLEKLYLARKAEGLSEDNDTATRRIRGHLGNMGMIGQTLQAMVQSDALVLASALQPFYELSAEAARVLQAESAPVETIH